MICENGFITIAKGEWKLRIEKAVNVPLTYGGKALFECSHRERKRGRDLTWTLRGMPAPE